MLAGCRVEDVFDGIDRTTPGCSIKDSYADLDLEGHGFHVLFEARWIAGAAGKPPPALRPAITWEPVVDDDGFAVWERTQRGDGPGDVLRASLLDQPDVGIWRGVERGHVVAGAVLSGRDPVGISNVFGPSGRENEVWRSLVGAIGTDMGPVALVGYESGAALVAAMAAGLSPIGDLRVWLAS
jgi:hypothetical protein